MQASSVISLSPSFNSYSNADIAEIAARVVGEFSSDELYDEFHFDREENPSTGEDESSASAKDEEFEFAFVTRDSDLSNSPVSADEIFHNGQIRPVYPVFNRNLFVEFQNRNEKVRSSDPEKSPKIRLPLRKLFIEERESTMANTTSSCSSSDVDDLDGVPAETYCVWRPKEAAEELRKKSSSTGGSNSKRWKFKDLLYNRSHSDGIKDSFVFLSPSNSGRKKETEEEERIKAAAKGGGEVKPAAAPPPRYSREFGEKRRSYLPYKQDLVGLFSSVNVNGFSKNLQPL